MLQYSGALAFLFVQLVQGFVAAEPIQETLVSGLPGQLSFAQQVAQPSAPALSYPVPATAQPQLPVAARTLGSATFAAQPASAAVTPIQATASAATAASSVANVAAQAQAPGSAATAANNAANAAVTAANVAAAAAAAANTAANAAASASAAATAAANSNTDAKGDKQPVSISAQPSLATTVAPQTVAVVPSATVASAVSATVASADANVAAAAAAEANKAASTAANAAATASAAATAAANDAKSAAKGEKTSASISAQPNPALSVASQPVPAVPVVPLPATPGSLLPPTDAWSSSQWYYSQLMNFARALTFAMVVKVVCVLGNVLVQVSPFPQVRRWESRGCTGEADAAPFVSIAFGGWQWCFYGVFAWLVTARSGFLVLFHSNCVGAVLGTYYVRAFYLNCRDDAVFATLQKYLSAVTALVLLQVCSISVLPAERALFLTGLISSFCSFVGATSVLVTVPAVIRAKDSRSIPGPYAIASLASALAWSLCGYLLDDPMVMLPNMFCTFCCSVSLGLKVYYPSDMFADGEELETAEKGNNQEEIAVPSKKMLQTRRPFRASVPSSDVAAMKPLVPKVNKVNAGTFSDAGQPLRAAEASGGDGTGGTF